ncbi:hypothetical protein RI129_005640 [Pyrocoelia pectoralis]|uniref:DUF4371 domain-containing protein n=1 Tax=Pyrocoelia pectoralis TaxID=417401 RepID=A0AAN7V9R6_9COLE
MHISVDERQLEVTEINSACEEILLEIEKVEPKQEEEVNSFLTEQNFELNENNGLSLKRKFNDFTTSVAESVVINVNKLKSQNKLNCSERLRLKERGVPRPCLQIKQTTMFKNKPVRRYFRQNMYEMADWLCGCEVSNTFYCFPCLLFSNDTVWCKIGVNDLKHFKDKMKKHALSANHMKSSMSFETLGHTNIRTQLDGAYRKSVKDFNENVSKNRYILNKIIDCVKSCRAFELTLRGHDEREFSESTGMFRDFVNFAFELDSIFKEHLDKSSVFKGISKSIQNDLLESMLYVAHDKIKSEIRQADFVAVQVDETTDSSNKTQMIFIFRYILNGDLHERFWKCINPIPTKVEDLTNIILRELNNLEINKTPEKLVAQSYDGAAVTSGKFGGVQRKVKDKYRSATFIHCYAHRLNLILQKAVGQNKSMKVFFASLHGFSLFFGKSSKRMVILDEVVKVRLPKRAPTEWCFDTRCVETVFVYQKDILACLSKIIDKEDDNNTLSQAIVLENYLRDSDFLYWLEFFHMIIPHCYTLFNQLKKRDIVVSNIKNYIATFKDGIEKIRAKILNNSLQFSLFTTISNKRPRNEDSKHQTSLEVCDIVLSEIQQRFRFSDHLVIAQLFYPERFVNFREKFPADILQLVKASYPFINYVKLRTELEVMYEREDFDTNAGLIAILQFYINNNLCETFSESIKLLKILCTLPMPCIESERCFSTLKRVTTFLQNTMEEDEGRLCALAMLTMEKPLIRTISNFNEQVVDHFAKSKDTTIDVVFKSA